MVGGIEWGGASLCLRVAYIKILASYRVKNPLKSEIRFKSPPLGIGLSLVLTKVRGGGINILDKPTYQILASY